jgi:hypothetical protein
MALEDNLGDLRRHAGDFAARSGFTYTVLAGGGLAVHGRALRGAVTAGRSPGLLITRCGSTNRDESGAEATISGDKSPVGAR